MKTIYILIALVIHVITFAQDDNPIFGAVQVTYSSHNNKEDSYYSYENERYLLWEESNGNIDFANVILVQNSHSMGSVTNIKVDKVNQFHTIYYFDWKYSNSYDEVKGVANVNGTVFMVLVPQAYSPLTGILKPAEVCPLQIRSNCISVMGANPAQSNHAAMSCQLN